MQRRRTVQFFILFRKMRPCWCDVQTDATTPNNVEKDTTHKTLETMCNPRGCANGSNIVALRFSGHGTKN